MLGEGLRSTIKFECKMKRLLLREALTGQCYVHYLRETSVVVLHKYKLSLSQGQNFDLILTCDTEGEAVWI